MSDYEAEAYRLYRRPGHEQIPAIVIVDYHARASELLPDGTPERVIEAVADALAENAPIVQRLLRESERADRATALLDRVERELTTLRAELKRLQTTERD